MAKDLSEREVLEELRRKFMFACKDGQMDVIDSILANGFDVNFQYDPFGTSPLCEACLATEPWVIDVVTKLIEHGADVDWADESNETALDRCLNKAPFQEHVAQLLLDCSKLGVNRVFINNTNYLFFANSVDALKFLVKNGININNVDTWEEEGPSTKLDYLYGRRGNKNCIEYLTSIGGKRYDEL